MPSTSRTSRLGDYGAALSRNGGDEQILPTAPLAQGFSKNTKSWNGSSIWSSGALGAGFGSATRDSSRSRENGVYSTPDEDVEGKTGSGSLVSSSETDAWSRQRSPWGTVDNYSQPTSSARTSGVSPVLQRASNHSMPPQSFLDTLQTTTQLFSTPRASALGQSVLGKAGSKHMLDSTAANLGGLRMSDAVSNGYNGFGRHAESDEQRAPESTRSSWTDAVSIHSPTDDRRSNANSDYFGVSSAAASRSGSLPPSRHGTDPAQFSQPSDVFPRFSQVQPPSMRGNLASLSVQSNGRGYGERSNSFQSETTAMFGRLSMENSNSDQVLVSHKPSVSINGFHTQLSNGQYDSLYPRQPVSDLAHELDDGLINGGSFTPAGHPGGFYGDHHSYRSPHIPQRGAMTPSSSEFRPSPYYSTGGTPPVFDNLYPSRHEQLARALTNGNSALLESKLRGLQQEQQLLHPQYQQMVAAQFRGQYNPYGYGASNSIALNGFTPGISMPPMPGIVSALEPFRGSRPEDAGHGIRSALLEEFKSNSKGNRRYELKDIYDHIVEFSGDQHGSRFIQQKLETANSDEKERVFKEIQGDAMQLMTDVFGNYVIQKFFEHGDQNMKKILANKMKGQVLNLSLQMYGCRVVQKALEHILTDQQSGLVKELENNVLKCVKDQNGNHVIQKAIERVPSEHIQFIINSFHGQVGQLAVHPYGCRVIQRMLEHCEEPARRSILQELHCCDSSLISDQYGNYVTQHIIEHGAPEDRAKIIARIRDQLLLFSRHKFASNVVEKCLVCGTDEQRRDIMLKVVEKTDRGESTLSMLLKDGYGNYVIQKLLDTLSATDYTTFLEYLQPEMLKVRRTVTGKQVLAVEKKMHRFGRHDVVLDMVLRNSANSPTPTDNIFATATTPPLTHDTQSSQSNSLTSTTLSIHEEPIRGPKSKPPPAIPDVRIATVT